MQPLEAFELILTLLGLVFVLHWVALRLKWSPATVLLVGGGTIAFIPGLPRVELDPDLALALFLPPLLVDGAYNTALGRFRYHIRGVLSLAVGAIIFTTLAVGLVVHWIVPTLPWAVCFALGAVVSPPDAVSARAVLKGVTIPRRLATLLEGESLLNDATGLILFRFAVAAALTGGFSLMDAAWNFSFLAVGGALVGAAVGYAWLFLVRRLTDRMLVIGLNLLLCWASYLAAEAVHVSGVIAVVVTGMIQGWYQHEVVPAAMRLQGGGARDLISFVLEALVFILIGFSLRGVVDRMGQDGGLDPSMAWAVLGVVLTVTAARFVWVFGGDAVMTVALRLGLKREPLGWRQATVLSWAGMRGVVTLAIALTVPLELPGRDLILLSAFAVIFITVVAQGCSLGWVIRQVKPVDREPPAETNMAEAEVVMARAKLDVVKANAYGPDGTLQHPVMLELQTRRTEYMEHYAEDAEVELENMQPQFDISLKAVAAARRALLDLHRRGRIEDEVLNSLERDLDVEEMAIFFQRTE